MTPPPDQPMPGRQQPHNEGPEQATGLEPVAAPGSPSVPTRRGASAGARIGGALIRTFSAFNSAWSGRGPVISAPGTGPAPGAPSVPTRRDTWIGAGIVAALILGCAGFLQWRFGHRYDRYDPGQARLACEEGVKDKLGSPESADFSDVSVIASGTTFTVTGTVDSDNALGGSIRNTFTCTVSIEDDIWSRSVSLQTP